MLILEQREGAGGAEYLVHGATESATEARWVSRAALPDGLCEDFDARGADA